MESQVIKPKEGETYIIPSYEGEVVVLIEIYKPLNNLTLRFPEKPFPASKVRIYTTQDIENLTAIGTFNGEFTSLPAGDIGFVWCPAGREYLCTGQNNIVPVKPRHWFTKLLAKIRGKD